MEARQAPAAHPHPAVGAALGSLRCAAEPGPGPGPPGGGLPELLPAGATRLLSDDGAFEPDSCLFVGAAAVRAAVRTAGYLDTRKSHSAPDLVVEGDRSADSTRKLEPYFRMGVREAWTWSRGDGARIWVADPGGAGAFRPRNGAWCCQEPAAATSTACSGPVRQPRRRAGRGPWRGRWPEPSRRARDVTGERSSRKIA